MQSFTPVSPSSQVIGPSGLLVQRRSRKPCSSSLQRSLLTTNTSRRLGIAKSGIYHHVSGKEELLRLALDRALDGLWEAGERARGLNAPAIERLETLVRDAVLVLAERLPYVTLLLRVPG